MTSLPLVNLVCIKEKSKLRIRIVSPGYKKEANCQFPRNLRIEGRKFTAPSNDVSLVKHGSSYFYRVKPSNIKVVDEHVELELSQEYKDNLKIYGENNHSDCVVCMCEVPDAVFGPCGHLSCCMGCANVLYSSTGKCPMCRSGIDVVIDYGDLK